MRDGAALESGDAVLVTGSGGRVGRALIEVLERAGLSVVRFDLTDGDDVTDPDALTRRSAAAPGWCISRRSTTSRPRRRR